jgi:hypothetical protein
LTAHAVGSDWVRAEVNTALRDPRFQGRVIPVRLDESVPSQITSSFGPLDALDVRASQNAGEVIYNFCSARTTASRRCSRHVREQLDHAWTSSFRFRSKELSLPIAAWDMVSCDEMKQSKLIIEQMHLCCPLSRSNRPTACDVKTQAQMSTAARYAHLVSSGHQLPNLRSAHVGPPKCPARCESPLFLRDSTERRVRCCLRTLR